MRARGQGQGGRESRHGKAIGGGAYGSTERASASESGGKRSCTIVVQANPTTTGSRASTLTRTCTLGGTVSSTADGLTLTGLNPNIALAPTTRNFGNVNVGVNSSLFTFTYTNSGSADATGCSSASLTGTNPEDFSITTNGCGGSNITASGGSCTIVVQGTPTTTGARTTSLTRTCTFGGTVSSTADGLTMTSLNANIALSPTSQSFGNVNVGSNSSLFTFTYSNSGTADATGCSAASLTGTNPGDFTITSNGCGTSNITASGGITTIGGIS